MIRCMYLMNSFISYYLDHYDGQIKYYDMKIDSLNRLYMAALMEMQAGKHFYPDANGTLESYLWQVDGYQPNDGCQVSIVIPTIDGIMEKENPDIDDYHVPDKLKELYRNKDYGKVWSE